MDQRLKCSGEDQSFYQKSCTRPLLREFGEQSIRFGGGDQWKFHQIETEL